MYLLKEAPEEYSWNYGNYPKEHLHQICLQTLTIVWLLFHERMTIMKSWFSNLFHLPSAAERSASTETPGATLNFTKQSQPGVKCSMDYHLPVTRHFGTMPSQYLLQHPEIERSSCSNPNIFQDKCNAPESPWGVNSSTYCQDFFKQASALTLCARKTSDISNLLWFSESMAFWPNSFTDSKKMPDDHQYSCSAPSVLCVREMDSRRMNSKSSTDDRMRHHKQSDLKKDLKASENCRSMKKVDNYHDVSQPDQPVYHETETIVATSQSSFTACSNPIIAYILGLDENCDYSDESDNDFDECFSQVNGQESWTVDEFWKDDSWNSSSESSESLAPFKASERSSENESECNLNSCESDGVVLDTSEEDCSLISSSFSDYWSDDSDCINSFLENSIQNCPNLQKPSCSNSDINYILNIGGDSHVDTQDHQTKQNTCNENIWENSLKTDDEFSLFFGSKLVATTTGQCYSSAKQNCLRKKSVCKVRFDENPPTVHHMFVWSFAYKQSRCGPWESHARDRERFRIRIKDVESAISWCFLPPHREAVWEKRISSTFPQ